MAGGKLAEVVPCMVCMADGTVASAKRVYEGDEDDRYQCEQGHTFGIDFGNGPATAALWPPPAETGAQR